MTTLGTCPIYLCSVCADSMIAFIFFYLCLWLLSPPCASLSLSLFAHLSHFLSPEPRVPFHFLYRWLSLINFPPAWAPPVLPFLFPLVYLLLWPILSSRFPLGLEETLQPLTNSKQLIRRTSHPWYLQKQMHGQTRHVCVCVRECVCIKAFSTANLCLGGVINT